MENRSFYNEILTEHNMRPEFKHDLPDANIVLEGVNPNCGDDIWLKLEVENGIIKDMSILDNGSIVHLPKIRKGPFIDFARQEELFRQQEEALHIKMGDRLDLIGSLSGGNQQKVVLAKWLMSGPKVLILDNPTQGVDVGAKEEIYTIIHRLAEDGVAVIVLRSEAQEIIRVCDRSLVMFHGHVVGEVAGSDMNEHNIMYLATGGGQQDLCDLTMMFPVQALEYRCMLTVHRCQKHLILPYHRHNDMTRRH